MNTKKIKPFLKWAGGKTQLIDAISKKFPYQKAECFTYVEPFVGSGAVLFWVLQNYPEIKRAVINDVNPDLINTYNVVAESVDDLIDVLTLWSNEYQQLANQKSKRDEYYYHKRDKFNARSTDAVYQAALFIFLNKTCFNGLYRVNRNNIFNVPVGSYTKPLICDSENLRAVSRLLKNVTILNGDFTETLNYAGENTCFYLDPPYKPLTETANFTSYAKNQFNDTEQLRLKMFCDKLDSHGYKWILSNSDIKSENPDNGFFDDLYENYSIDRVLAKRSINVNANKRGHLNELLINNFKA